LSLFGELKRRNVIRMAGLYLVGAWLITQVASTLLPVFDAPGWLMKTVVWVLVIGFVPATALSWVFELTPEGLKRDSELPQAHSIEPKTAQRMNRLIVGLLAVAVAYFGIDKFVLAPSRDAALVATTSQAVKEATLAGAESTASSKSIAVLPFVDMSPERDQEYFSDGIAEELLNRLAQIPDLQVAARTSAFQFKGKNLDIADIGRQLNVAHVLEGSVRKHGTRLRITAQLINSASGFHLWSQAFEGDVGEVFKVQDEIAAAITDALKTRLSSGHPAARPALSADPLAYDDYLQGRAFTARRVDDNLKLAVAAFDRAIARDPSYSPAHSGRAFALSLSQIWSPQLLPAEEVVAQTRASADEALKLDPENVEAMISRGYVAMRHWDVSGARVDFERAHALAPDNVDVLNLYADFLHITGNLRAAERMKRKAMALDPLSFVHPRDLFWILVEQSRLPDALAMAERGLGLGSPDARLQMVVALAGQGQFERAEREFDATCPGEQARSTPCMGLRLVLLVANKQATDAEPLFEKFVATDGADGAPGYYSYLAGAYANDFGNIAKATQYARKSLGGDSTNVLNPLRWSTQAPRLPEEISRDPEWLAVWDDPKLRDLMTMFRANTVAFREGG